MSGIEPKEKKGDIDLIELVKHIWLKKGFVLKVTVIFLLFGLIIALTSKVEYKASCKLLPEDIEGSSANLGGLGGIAGLAGVDLGGLGGSASVMSPELYPNIVKSHPFTNKLLTTPVYFEKMDTTITCYYYFRHLDKPSLIGTIISYTIGLPGKLKKSFSSEEATQSKVKSDFIRYSKSDWKLISAFSGRLTVNTDDPTGIISLETEMPDAVAAAQVTELMVNELTNYVINYKVSKAKENLNFVEDQFETAKLTYEAKQAEVARYVDGNRNLTNSLVQIENQRLQNELDIAFEVYKGLATQLEQAKIKVNEETPIFTVLEPVRIPEDKSKPKRTIMVLVSILIGAFVAVSIVVIRKLLTMSNE